jgi:hypothetical protein
MTNPTEQHWLLVKRVLAYLKGTKDHGLTYCNNPLTRKIPEITGFSDSNYASDKDDRKSIGSYVFILNNGSISWVSKKQQTVAKSTTEAEYMALSQAASEGYWLRMFIKEIGFNTDRPLVINGDNQGSIKLTQNPQFHNRTKHIDIRHHYIRELVELNHISVEYVSTNDMIADILTKPLGKLKFVKFRECLGVKRISASGGVEK